MQTRRDFLRNAAVLTGSAFVWGSIPEAIAKAAAIDPEKGTTFLDAEHVVILMQENRSFDHCYGALRGVRGFRDPRAHVLPDGNPVWFQTDAQGHTYAPFRLDMKETNSTWIGGLPHSWRDQVDARNGGRYDKWLLAKSRKELPLTLGHYARADLPFYYAFADAFTVCDAAFCSSLTGTTPNRLFLWSGTIREDAESFPRVQNGDTDYDSEASWTTFPERLQDAGVSWRVYQNEISLDTGFRGEEDSWLANFTDNPLEWLSQYRVRFSKGRRAHLARRAATLPGEIAAKARSREEEGLSPENGAKLDKELAALQEELKNVTAEREAYNDATWAALSERERALHENAFATNADDPDSRSLTTLEYRDGDTERRVQVPKGDTLHGFRKDVEGGKLPAVSWIVAPENFSDHPSSAWYGAWYVSEVLDILTKNPEVWKKTIFVLCYDENDGYFDHVPPFTAPHPDRPETGRVSEGIDTTVDWAVAHDRDHAIGLGFRCPMVVASPWSRGGCVNSEVFDHTSVIQLVETWLAGKGKPVRETNISDWRRTVCGDLTSSFRPYRGEAIPLPKPLERDATVEGIHAARFKAMPKGGASLSGSQIAKADVGTLQEAGTRPSCPLPYELAVNATRKGDALTVTMEARDRRFGKQALGAPFNAYVYGEAFASKAYAVKAGDAVQDTFPAGGIYHVRVDGPNGFMREFRGTDVGPEFTVTVEPKGDGLEVRIHNAGSDARTVELRDESYGAKTRRTRVAGGGHATLTVDPKPGRGWYDFTVSGANVEHRYAGRVETGRWGVTDPAMGGKVEA